MSGYVGNLSEAQSAALDQLKAELGPVLPAKEFYDDRYLLRFLRARKFDVPKANEMCRNDIAWRAQNNIDQRLQGPPPDDMVTRYAPLGLHGYTKAGNAIVVERTGIARHIELLKFRTQDQILDNHVFYQESAMDLCRKRGLEKMYVIMDMKGLAMWKATKPVLDIYKAVGALDEAHYCETLEKVYVVNSSWVFLSIWKIAKAFFDKDVVSKTIILGANFMETIQKDIDVTQIPDFLGGKCNDPVCHAQGGCLSGPKYSPDAHAKEASAELMHLHIAAGAVLVRRCEVKAGFEVSWEFLTDNHNIVFGVTFKVSDSDSRETVVHPMTHIECNKHLHSGVHKVEKDGILLLTWSNAKSWMTGKDLRFNVYVVNPNADGIVLA